MLGKKEEHQSNNRSVWNAKLSFITCIYSMLCPGKANPGLFQLKFTRLHSLTDVGKK